MDNLIKNYKKARKVFIDVISLFPENKRLAVIFGSWSLKDIMAHIIGWERLSIEKVKAVKNGNLPKWIDNVEKQNIKIVDKYKNKSWSGVYEELIKSGNEMIREYESLPVDLWTKQAGPNPQYTPQRFLEQETKHYQSSHLQKIEHFLRNV